MAHTGYSGYRGVCNEVLVMNTQLEEGAYPRLTYEGRDFRLFLCKYHFNPVNNLSRMFWVVLGSIPERTASICPLRMALGQQKCVLFALKLL